MPPGMPKKRVKRKKKPGMISLRLTPALYPDLAKEFKRRVNGELPENWEADAQKFIKGLQANPATASRKAWL